MIYSLSYVFWVIVTINIHFRPHFSCFRFSTHILYFRNQVFPVWNHPIFRLFFRPLEKVQTANDSKCDIPWIEIYNSISSLKMDWNFNKLHCFKRTISNKTTHTHTHTREMTFSQAWLWTSHPFAMCCHLVWYVCANVGII